ncbi:MAG: hypothetical protein IJX92_00625 [Clostridia bacterium]|nr:hypothetical protein [Clostridia bacterium]
MIIQPKQRNIAYRCPECASSIFGIVGKFALSADMLRLKCSCDKGSALDINKTNDGKIRLSVPCLFCKQNHSYVVSESVFFDRDKFLLNCPYTGMDIAFIGDEQTVNSELARTEEEIRRLMAGFEAEDISELQPEDMNEDEILPDPAVYDTLRFLVKDLEAEGKLECLCNEGSYELRFCDGGVQVYCERCGATYTFGATTPALAEEYLNIDYLKLK